MHEKLEQFYKHLPHDVDLPEYAKELYCDIMVTEDREECKIQAKNRDDEFRAKTTIPPTSSRSFALGRLGYLATQDPKYLEWNMRAWNRGDLNNIEKLVCTMATNPMKPLRTVYELMYSEEVKAPLEVETVTDSDPEEEEPYFEETPAQELCEEQSLKSIREVIGSEPKMGDISSLLKPSTVKGMLGRISKQKLLSYSQIEDPWPLIDKQVIIPEFIDIINKDATGEAYITESEKRFSILLNDHMNRMIERITPQQNISYNDLERSTEDLRSQIRQLSEQLTSLGKIPPPLNLVEQQAPRIEREIIYEDRPSTSSTNVVVIPKIFNFDD